MAYVFTRKHFSPFIVGLVSNEFRLRFGGGASSWVPCVDSKIESKPTLFQLREKGTGALYKLRL